MKSLTATMDKTAIGFSVACALHCLLLPVTIILLPTFTANILANEYFHQMMLWVVLPTSLLALFMGCRKHRNMSVLALGLPGLIILSLAAFIGHDLLGETGEKVASVLGAFLIALGHLKNHRLCRNLCCDCRSTANGTH